MSLVHLQDESCDLENKGIKYVGKLSKFINALSIILPRLIP